MNPANSAFSPPTFRSRVVPVVALTDAGDAVPLAEALFAGGIDVIEVTLRHPCALEAIAAIARALPAMHLGAGTLLQAQDVQRVIDAGAQFALSPGCTPALVEAVIQARLPFIPGVMTPSEVITARAAGFRLQKLFPATLAGGIDMLKALAAVLPDVQFCPTGGIKAETLPDFLSLPNVAMAGGTWLSPATLIAAGDWQAITLLARQATQSLD